MNTEVQGVKRRFGIIGNSSGLNHAIYRAIQVAPTDISVLIEGESGVGKEVFSHIIHQLSTRKHNKFIAVNCGAIPEGTINSELFGHEKGAFTGAAEKRSGYFESVDGGTIFLDEIGEMPLETQALLLRVLETGEFIKVGSSKVQKTDVRVIAATNVDLFDRISQGKFREDLYYRLNTVSITIPPLRERREDIHLLFRRFAVDFAEKYSTTPVRLDERAIELLCNHSWQGNIRQLKNVAEQVSVLAPSRNVEGEEILNYLPKQSYKSLLPVKFNAGPEDPQTEFSEREILYKFLYEIKKDVTELKKVVNDITDTGLEKDITPVDGPAKFDRPKVDLETGTSLTRVQSTPPISESGPASFNRPFHANQEIEDVEETLSIEEMEKRMIKNALKRHKGRRKEAALQLGISERTLYRKIKQYDLDE